MALKALLDTLEGVEETLHGFYAEQKEGPNAGKFLLQVEGTGGLSLEDVSGLKSALGKERSRADAAEKKIANFGDLDPDKAREALEKYDALSQLDPAKEADKIVEERVKAVREKMAEAHQKELDTLRNENQALKGEAEQTAKLRVKASAFDAHGVMPERRQALDAYVDRYIRTETRDGKRQVVVVDDEGAPRIATDGSNMDVSTFVETLKTDPGFAWAFQGTDKSGGGTPTGRNGGGTAQPQVSKMSRAEKAKALAEGSLDPAALASSGE